MNTSPQVPEMIVKWIVALSNKGLTPNEIAVATTSAETAAEFGFTILKEDLVDAILWKLENQGH